MGSLCCRDDTSRRDDSRRELLKNMKAKNEKIKILNNKSSEPKKIILEGENVIKNCNIEIKNINKELNDENITDESFNHFTNAKKNVETIKLKTNEKISEEKLKLLGRKPTEVDILVNDMQDKVDKEKDVNKIWKVMSQKKYDDLKN